MHTKNQISLIRKILYGIMLIAILFVFSELINYNTKSVSASPLLQQGSCPSVVLPTFKLPWNPNWNPNGSNPKIYFTGGPHQFEKGGQLTATYTYGLGSGIDFAPEKDQSFKVAAMASGHVVFAGDSPLPGLGTIIAIKHDVGTSVLIYSHLDNASRDFLRTKAKLNTQQKVEQGEIISDSGNSGSGAKGHHLHLELRDGSVAGPVIGWECVGYHNGQIDGYWIWGYAKGDTYGSGAQMYNYDGVAVKGDPSRYKLTHNFSYIDQVSPKIVHKDVTTVVGVNFNYCPNPSIEDCEINTGTGSDPNTQFAKIGTGGFWNATGQTVNLNQVEGQSSGLSSGVLLSTNESPAISNDKAVFISDITLPDGAVVSPSQSLTKTWRVKNSGTSTWTSFKLKFVDGEQVGGPSEITIPTTAPGATVDISINLVSPSTTGLHNGSWQIVNQSGTWVQGGKLWVSIETLSSNPGGQITMFDVSPSSPSSTNTVHVVGRIKPSPDFRSMRFVLGNEVQEMINFKQVGDQYEISTDWNTASLARGNYSIVFEAAKTGDSSWANAERQVKTYSLIGTPVSLNLPPDRPVLKSPYDWYLKDSAGASTSVELCVYPSSDPDGNPIQYWFEVKDQGGGVYANSGWNSSTCWTHTYAPTTYSWRVKTGDGSAESDWSSDIWHFSVAGGGVYIGSDSLFEANTDNTHLCVFVTYDGIQGPDVRAWINESPDGSENGVWRQLDHYGPNTNPDCTQSNYHGFWIRSTKYQTGNHAVRITAVKPDSGNSATKKINYNIAYIRPPTPELIAPSTNTNNGTWWNNRSVHFEWNQSLRADNYTLRVSTNPNPWADPAPILNQVLGSSITSYDYTFSQDYAKLYWSVQASNSAGSSDSGGNVWFGIDLVKPACQVQSLPSTTYSNVFQVNWNSTDNSAGIQSASIQFTDSTRGIWEDWLTDTPFAKTYDLFAGQPGHNYFFRCRATDNANNTGNYPAGADTSITIDPFTLPGTPWWNAGYSAKRNIVILNNMPGVPLSQGYPIHLHFDGSTTPTAAAVYDSSLSNPKCNDLRIVYNDAIELDRIVDRCTSAAIDIWFRAQVSVPGGTSNNTAHQLYFGNSSAGSPPVDRNHIFYPALDANYIRVFDMREGSGSTLFDATGNGSATMGSELSWTTSGKFGPAVLIPGDQTPEPRYAINAGYGPQPTCDFTAELWLKRLTGHQYGGQLIQQEIGGPNPWRWAFTLNGDRLRLSKEGVSDAVESSGTLANSTYFNHWHHIAVTYSCSGQVRFYIDGALDSIKNFSAGGLNSASAPLRIGNNAYNNNRIAGYISGAAVSNVVRTGFTHGTFAAITNEPSVAADSVITPPVVSGVPDLALLSLSTYPNPAGGVIVEAVVENQGDLSTTSGFYTDLYLNHVPTSAGDYSSSVRFWINDPIGPAQITTLTTVITDLLPLPAFAVENTPSVMNAGTFTESSGTLYAQTDSAGLVQELDNQNNIYSIGTQICIASPDTFENDDTYTAANLILIGNSQTQNFDVPGDQDWIKFNAVVGQTYTISTSTLGVSNDTHLSLYGTDGVTLIASNDDYNGTLASQIDWQPTVSGTYYILVNHWNPSVGGCGMQYTISVQAPPPPALSLTVSKVGTGSGSIVSVPVGINCGVTCAYSFAPNTVVTLTATPTPFSTFGGWSGGGCSGTGTCIVTMSSAQSVTATFTALITGGGSTTGVFRPSNGLLYLKNQNTTGYADVAINYGTGGDYPIAGDWDGNGTATIGIYRNGFFYLRNSNTLGFADIVFAFGTPGDQPVAGDWDGDGVDTIGVFSNGQFLLRNSNSAGVANMSFYLGNPGDVGIAGDWNGDGLDTTGVFRPSNGIIFLKNANTTGFADIALNYGLAGDMPVTGDWNNDGIDTIGVYRNAQFLLRNSNTIGFAEIVFGLGNPGDMPISGNWDGIP